MAQNWATRRRKGSKAVIISLLILVGLFSINLALPTPVAAANAKISEIIWYKDIADAFNETSLSFKVDNLSGFNCRFIIAALPNDMGTGYYLKGDYNYYTFDGLLTDNCASPGGLIIGVGNTYTAHNLKLWTPDGYNESFIPGVGDYIKIKGQTLALDLVFTDEEIYYFTTLDNITINYPVDGSNITDFTDWTLSYNTDKTDAYINLYYTDSITSYYSQNGFYVPAVPVGPTLITIPKTNVLTFGNWIIEAYLNSEAETEPLAGDIANFIISVEGGSGVPTPTCEGGGWVGNVFCEVLTYLFVPSDASLNRFSTLSNDIKNKPPMGYFIAIKNVFQNIGHSAAPAFNLEGIAALEPIFSPIKTGLAFIFWLAFGVWLYNRVRNFDL